VKNTVGVVTLTGAPASLSARSTTIMDAPLTAPIMLLHTAVFLIKVVRRLPFVMLQTDLHSRLNIKLFDNSLFLKLLLGTLVKSSDLVGVLMSAQKYWD